MIFCNLENLPSKIEALKQTDVLFYLDGNVIQIKIGDAKPLDSSDVKKLKSFYAKALHFNTGVACEDCREHHLVLLNIEFQKFLVDMDRRYG